MSFNKEKKYKIAILSVFGIAILIVSVMGKSFLYKANEIVYCNSSNYKWKINPSSIYEAESVFNKSNEYMLEFVNAKESNRKDTTEFIRITNLLLERSQQYKKFEYNHKSNDVILNYAPIHEGPLLFCSFRNGKLYNELYIGYERLRE